MARMAAFIVLLIPGLMAAAGIKFMRDTLFSNLIFPFPWLWLQFIVGIVFFLIGFGFFAGFLLHRDRKKGKVADRWQKKPIPSSEEHKEV
ncbi:MAG: DUF2627 domain-containing protein [Lysinibacillus sp.]